MRCRPVSRATSSGPAGLDRAAILALDATAGARRPVEISWPGKVIEDADGVPTAMEPTRRYNTPVEPTVFTRADLAAAGVEPDEVPNSVAVDA